MEEAQAHPRLLRYPHQLGLRAIDRPVGGQVSAILVAVGVAEHHFLQVAARGSQPGAVFRQRQQCAHRARRRLEVGDGFKERHDVHRQTRHVAGDEEARFAQQDRDLENIGHRRALRDHVMADHAWPESAYRDGGLLDDRQLALHQGGVWHFAAHQRSRCGQLATQHRRLCLIIEHGVIAYDTGKAQQLIHHLHMHIAVLPQVECAEMKSEQVDGGAYRLHARVGQPPGAVRVQRCLDDGEVAREFGGIAVRRQRCVRCAARHHAQCLLRSGGQTRMHAAQGATVRLIGAEGRVVARGIGQRQQLSGRCDQSRRHRQLERELEERVQVMGECRRGLTVHRQVQHVGSDEGIAITIAADPRAHAHHRWHTRCASGCQRIDGVLYRDLQGRELTEKRQLVVPQRLGDFIAGPQLGQPEQGGLPERQHLQFERRFPRHQFLGIHSRAIALDQQLGDAALGVEDRLAAHFGGVRGEHRADFDL